MEAPGPSNSSPPKAQPVEFVKEEPAREVATVPQTVRRGRAEPYVAASQFKKEPTFPELWEIKALSHFHVEGKPRLIVAGMFLHDGRAAFVDRKNSELLIGDVDSHSYETFDLKSLIPDEYKPPSAKEEVQYSLSGIHHSSSEDSKSDLKPHGFYRETRDPGSSSNVNHPKHRKTEHKKVAALPLPSDVNRGQKPDQLLVTFTHTDHSIAVLCDIKLVDGAFTLSRNKVVKVKDRTRSVVAVDGHHFSATTPENVVILSADGDCLAVKNRIKRDRGGLLMTDGHGMMYYGDGDTYVACRWSEQGLVEVFRYSNKHMKFPRGSAMTPSGILVCCDSSHNIHLVTPKGVSGNVVHFDGSRSFGDVDVHPDGTRFITTFWTENEWPLLFKIQ